MCVPPTSTTRIFNVVCAQRYVAPSAGLTQTALTCDIHADKRNRNLRCVTKLSSPRAGEGELPGSLRIQCIQELSRQQKACRAIMALASEGFATFSSRMPSTDASFTGEGKMSDSI